MNDIRMSATSLSLFMRCERRYYYAYVFSIPRDWSWPLEMGSAVHEVMAAYDDAYENGLDSQIQAGVEAATEYLSLWEAWRWTDIYNPWQLARIPVWYAERFGSGSGMHPTHASEIRFEYPVDGITFNGRIDGLVEAFGEEYVLERKSSSKTVGENFYRAFLPDLQFSAYIWVTRLLWPERKIKGILLEGIQLATGWVDFGRYPVLRSNDEILEFEDSLHYYLDRRKTLNGQPMRAWLKNEASCFGCPFRGFCASSNDGRERWQTLPRDKG